MLAKTLLVLPAIASLASAANFDVSVGASGLTYTPNTVAPAVQDTITFHFSGPHSATQSTFASPCTPMSGGFNSGISSAGNTFVVTVNDTNPIWVYCEVPGHCQAGMVFAANAPSSGNTYAAFVDAAEGKAAPAAGSSSSAAGSSSTAAAAASSTTAASSSSNNGYGSSGASTLKVSSALAGIVGLAGLALLL